MITKSGEKINLILTTNKKSPTLKGLQIVMSYKKKTYFEHKEIMHADIHIKSWNSIKLHKTQWTFDFLKHYTI